MPAENTAIALTRDHVKRGSTSRAVPAALATGPSSLAQDKARKLRIADDERRLGMWLAAEERVGKEQPLAGLLR